MHPAIRTLHSQKILTHSSRHIFFYQCHKLRSKLPARPANLIARSRSGSQIFQRISMATSNGSAAHIANMGRGALIVLEGLDRSGKSSQCSMLSSFLSSQGIQVEQWRFPDRTTAVGKMISAYLSAQQDMDDNTIHLLFSANRWEKRSLMLSKLKAGTTLIVDRYSYSGVAFSAAKGLDLDWCKASDTGLPTPDLVLYLDIPAEKAAERGGYGVERYEQVDFQRKVAEKYKALSDSSWQIIDASSSLTDVLENVKELSLKCIKGCQQGKKLCHLWL